MFYLNINKVFLPSRRHRIQSGYREEKWKLYFWFCEIFPIVIFKSCTFRASKFLYYSLLKKVKFCVFIPHIPAAFCMSLLFTSFLSSPFKKYDFLFLFSMSLVFFFFFFLFIFSHPTDQAAVVGYCGSGTFPQPHSQLHPWFCCSRSSLRYHK